MFDFIGKKKIFFILSSAIVIVTILAALIMGVELDIQFKGGSIITYSYTGEINLDEVEANVEQTLGDQVSIQKTEGETQTIIISLAGDESLSIENQAALTEALTAQFPDNNLVLESSDNVNPVMGKEFFLKCLVAVAAASLLIILYIGIRFRKIGGFSAGAMGIVALLHDVIVVFAAFVFFRMPLDDNFIAAVLTILGFSINDTIVIYDRIRENERLYAGKKDLGEIVNLSINQSLTRSIITSFCGFLVMVVVSVVALINNVDSILSFAIPMMFGMISGSYSSIFIAGPLWVVWKNYRAKKAASAPSKKDKPGKSGGVGKIRV